jgi:hypothetical protein
MRRRDFLWTAATSLVAAPAPGLKARVAAALRRNLDALLLPSGDLAPVKGKAADALVAMSFDILHGATGEAKYRRAAITLADRTLAAMRATPVGILAIKEKGANNVMGGGPPALGWYASILGDLYRRIGGREKDLLYIAGVLDRYPWNPKGWWSATVDVRNGQAVMDLDKPSQINKNAAIAMACAVLGDAVSKLDGKLAESLRAKTRQNLESQIIPEQQSDGFWHYGGTGNDPNNKDVLGYFVLAIELLVWLGKFAPQYRTEAFKKCLAKAEQFAATSIAPITDPYHGVPAVRRTTRATPEHYNLEEEPKRGFALGVALVDGKYMEQATRIIDHVLQYFPPADRGEIGAKCTHDAATILTLL